MLYACSMNAQWRVGITAGADYNHYSRDNHYMEDWHYTGAWGASVGIMGQYNFTKWFGLRADFNWTQKNHKEYFDFSDKKYKYNCIIKNLYLQLPFMASFQYGRNHIKAFIHLGGYGGYWVRQNQMEMNKERDRRIDFGWIYGGGAEYKFNNHWALQAEARCYYSMQSTHKDYMRNLKDPRYNTTYTFQMALCYDF